MTRHIEEALDPQRKTVPLLCQNEQVEHSLCENIITMELGY